MEVIILTRSDQLISRSKETVVILYKWKTD